VGTSGACRLANLTRLDAHSDDADRRPRGRLGAKKESKNAAIIGCGAQAKYQLNALRAAFPLEHVRVFDIDGARAQAFAATISTVTCPVTPENRALNRAHAAAVTSRYGPAGAGNRLSRVCQNVPSSYRSSCDSRDGRHQLVERPQV
jgi:hypothetical protein